MVDLIRVDSTGVHVLSLTAAQTEMQQRFADIFGADLDTAAQTPQGQMAGLFAVATAEFGEGVTGIRNAVSPDHAQGTQQDTLFALVDVMRQQATRSRVTATVTGVAGTNLPEGSRARTTSGDEFQTVGDVALQSSPGVSVEMTAVETGPIEAAAGTLSRIVTVVPGWETVTNSAAAVVGMNRQTDPQYRQAYDTRVAHRALGPVAGINGALDEANAGRKVVRENRTSVNEVVQEFTLHPHALLVVVENGIDADIQRAVENHRGMGVPTMTAIRGGTHSNLATLQAITNGTINWNGTDYTAIDFSGATDLTDIATVVTTALDGDPTPPTVAYIDDAFVVQFEWYPGRSPDFADGATANALGLQDPAVAAPGPYIRTRTRNLAVVLDVTRQTGFPADGLDQIRAAVTAVVQGYGVGVEVWANDLISAAERIRGTRITSSSVQYNSADISGITPPLDITWGLPGANLTVNLT